MNARVMTALFLLTLGATPAERAFVDRLFAGTPADSQVASGELLQMSEAQKKPLVPLVLPKLQSKSADTRQQAVILLWSLAPVEPELVVPALERAMKDSSASVRLWAVHGMGRYKADRSLPSLLKALEDPGLSNAALLALGNYGPAAAPAVGAIVRAGAKERGAALQALGAIGPSAKSALPFVQESASDPDKFVRFFAIHAYGKIDPASEATIWAFMRALDDGELNVRQKACRELQNTTKDAYLARAKLATLLDRPEDRACAMDALAEIGITAKEVPLVERAMKEDPSLAWTGSQALAKLRTSATTSDPGPPIPSTFTKRFAGRSIEVSFYLRYVLGTAEPEAFSIESDCLGRRSFRQDENKEPEFRRCLRQIPSMSFEIGLLEKGKEWPAKIRTVGTLLPDEEVQVLRKTELQTGGAWVHIGKGSVDVGSDGSRWTCNLPEEIPQPVRKRICDSLKELNVD